MPPWFVARGVLRRHRYTNRAVLQLASGQAMRYIRYALKEDVVASGARSKPSRQKVREHRARLRAMGLRPIEIWVPDVNAPNFRAEAHRQSLAVANSPGESDDQAFIDGVSASFRDDE